MINSRKRLTTPEFIEKARKIHGDKYDYSKVKYIDSNTKVTIICPIHGEFEQRPANHISGQGCPKCELKSQTKLYNRLKSDFPDLNILFEINDKSLSWLDGQRLDIYIPELNVAIEYDGQQHYTPIDFFGGVLEFQKIVQLDKLKDKKCLDNGCILFRIKYNYTEEEYKDVTNKIEDLRKKWHEDKEDKYAIEAGKLLVKEILHNTDDRTNLIESVE